MRELGMAIEDGIMLCCVWALAGIFLGTVFFHIVRGWTIWKRKRNYVALSIFAVIACYVGGTKPPNLNITWDEGLHNNGSLIDTNNMHHITIAWTYDFWIPTRSTLTVSAIPRNAKKSTDELFVVASVPISDMSLEAYMTMDATNYLYFAEHSYIPDAPVLTNGVYQVYCVGGTNVWMPIGVKIYNGAERISPPRENHLIQGETP